MSARCESSVERLNAPATPGEVVRIVNEYVESRDAAVLTNLPVECQITPMHAAEEIADLRVPARRIPWTR
jgi:hypothetical protein